MFIIRYEKRCKMRKKDNTLRETLLKYARELADTKGAEAVNIRSIAQKAGIATGTVYNYFSNKDEILLALTEEYWKETLIEMKTQITSTSFCKQIEEIFLFLKTRIENSGGMFMHSLEHIEEVGQEKMESMQMLLRDAIIERMEQDKAIRKEVWNETFTKEAYACFIIMNIMILLRSRALNMDLLIEVIKRTIY